MRRSLLSAVGALAIVGLLSTPVVSAAPGQSSWESGDGAFFDQCTGEVVDNSFNVHFVSTDAGPSHFNLHLVGVGETTGARYEGQDVDNEFGHALPDGTFLIDQVLRVRVESQGNSANLTVISLHFHLVVDSEGNVISGFFDISQGICQGS
jgi:hypothetical protein